MLFRSREYIKEEIKGRECVLGLPRTMYDIRLQEGVYDTGNCLDKDQNHATYANVSLVPSTRSIYSFSNSVSIA